MITSLPDLLIIGGIALLVFGPKRLPELAKSLGKGIRDFKRAMDGEFEEDEKRQQQQQITPGQQQPTQVHTTETKQEVVPDKKS